MTKNNCYLNLTQDSNTVIEESAQYLMVFQLRAIAPSLVAKWTFVKALSLLMQILSNFSFK